MKIIYQLHLTMILNNEYQHFSEMFTSIAKIESFLESNPQMLKKEITLHEINPK